MKNPLRIYLFLILFFIFPVMAGADIYKWTDDNGVVHYSDEPRVGASQVELPAVQSYHSSNPISTQPLPPQSQKPIIPKGITDMDLLKSPPPMPQGLKGKNHQYSEVTIKKPSNEATIWDSEEKIYISVSLTPSLMEGDMVEALLDGKPSGDPQPSTELVLAGVGRGEHTVQVQVLNAEGKEIAKSQSVVVYVQHTSIIPPS